MKVDDLKQPTCAQCEAGEVVDLDDGRKTKAAWYPQMGGYVGRCWIVPSGDACFDVLIWHNGEFPFDGDGPEGRAPIRLHHCVARQFVEFGQIAEAHLGQD